MGVLVFLLALIPITGGTHMHIMRAESPGPSVDKLMPKVRQTAAMLYIIYITLTILEIIFLLAGKMPLFDALTTSFGTAGTGGFGIKNSSISDYSPYIQWVVGIFMMLFGVNFSFYFLLLMRRFSNALHFEEVRNYLIIIAGAVLIIMVSLFTSGSLTDMSFSDKLRHTFFQVSSVITTTGFYTIDYDNLWPQLACTVLIALMFIGACAGSTGGGIKVSRISIMAKTIKKELNLFFHPKRVVKIKNEHKVVQHEIIRSINVFFIAYIIVFSVSVLLVSVDGHDFATNFTAVAATINNIGPGLSKAGPTENFGFFSHFAKYVMIFDMLAGRLEVYPMLILFVPEFWKGLFSPNSVIRG